MQDYYRNKKLNYWKNQTYINMSRDSNMNKIDNYNELREYAIDEFIKKYDNDYRIVSSKIRQALDIVYFMNEWKFLVLSIDYGDTSNNAPNIYESNADDKKVVNSYKVMNSINYIEETNNGLVISCGHNKDNYHNYISNGIIYLNLNSLIRKYKIRNLI